MTADVRLLCNTDLIALAATDAGAKAEVTRRQAYDEDLNDRVIDLYHDGYFARRRGEPRPSCPYSACGWDDAERETKVVVVMPRRPEGYYHAPIGTFD